ncbi:MAG: diguanylate cyclase domain-containing protein, partial [Gemmatimonadota bacterium]
VRRRIRPRRRPAGFGGGAARRRRVHITVSIGAAQRNDRQAKPDDVVRAADEALYKAKGAGRNRVRT